MAIKQLSVFAENKPGAMTDITGILAQSGVDIRALSLADTKDYGILRLIVSDTEKAKVALYGKGYLVNVTVVTGVAIKDRAGSLCHTLTVLEQNGVNIEYMYAFIGRADSDAYLIIRTENADEADRILSADGEKPLDEKSLKQLLQ